MAFNFSAVRLGDSAEYNHNPGESRIGLRLQKHHLPSEL